jgi:IcmF-related N-terminal domain
LSVGSFLHSYWFQMIAAGTTLVSVVITFFWSKYPVRWLLAIATIALVVCVFIYFIPPGDLDEHLPATFRDHLPPWIVVLGLVALYSTTHFVATLVRLHADPSAGAEGAEGPFADIQAAWKEILIQLSQARIDPAGQELYLLLAPEESLAQSLVDAAGLEPFATAPASAEAPIHAFAVSDALFLSCSGASNMGSQGAEGTARLEFLCRLIAELNPERPILRGVAILVPFDWAQKSNSLRQVSAIRDDLQVIRRILKVRCPTLSVCCLPDSIPGFSDFVRRLPADHRHRRCGFSVPLSQGADAAVFRRGMAWMIRWFQVWSLNLMVADIREEDSNGRLLSMNVALRSGRDALARLLEAGLTVHQQDEPLFYRGCYFAAGGSSPENQAFAAGLLSGAKKGRLLADRELTTWSRDAELLDRAYRRWAYALAAGSAAIALSIWFYAIIPRLAAAKQEAFGWAALAVLALVWAGSLICLPSRRKTAA